MALVVVHHAVTAVVHDCQRLLAGVSVRIDLFLVPLKDLFDGGHTLIGLQNNVKVIEAVSFNVFAEDLHVFQDCGEVCVAILFWLSVFVNYQVSGCIYSRAPSDGRIIIVAKNEALAFVWREVGLLGHGFLLTEHFRWWLG